MLNDEDNNTIIISLQIAFLSIHRHQKVHLHPNTICGIKKGSYILLLLLLLLLLPPSP